MKRLAWFALLLAAAPLAGGCAWVTPKPAADYDALVSRPLTRRPVRVLMTATHAYKPKDEEHRLGWYARWRGEELLAEVRKIAPGAQAVDEPIPGGLDLEVDVASMGNAISGFFIGFLTSYYPFSSDRRFELKLRERGTLLARRIIDVTDHRHYVLPPPLFAPIYAKDLNLTPWDIYGIQPKAPEAVRTGEAKLCAQAVAEMLREIATPEQPAPRPARPAPEPAAAPDPEPIVAVASPPEGSVTAEPAVRLHANVAHPAGLGEVRVFVGDAPVGEGARGLGGVARAPGGEREQAVDVLVPLAVGENRIRLVVRSAAGRAVEVVRTVRREAAVGAGARGKWAVVVGVSRYKNAGAGFANLRFAAADARELAAVLTTECGFDPSHVRLLVDEQATSTALRDALFGFLGRAIEEDLVVIYFAGHGVPEPTNPKNLYLLTHEADPARLAATAFPMWDVETALQRSVKAERVLVLADACHSAGIAGDVGTRGAGDNAVNRSLAKLEEAGPGRAIFTASEAGELSQEDARWGGGHGAFTWHVVQALRGAADRDRDGIVTLGEMLDHVDEAVRRDTGSAQHPARGGRYDRRMPLAAVAR